MSGNEGCGDFSWKVWGRFLLWQRQEKPTTTPEGLNSSTDTNILKQFPNLFLVPRDCADRPSAPRRRLRALPWGFPDGGNGGRHSWNLVAALSRDGSHPCWHGDHFHHPRWGSAHFSFAIFRSPMSPNNQVEMCFHFFFSAAEKTRGKRLLFGRKSAQLLVAL